ncbi:MAG: hypothetical protein U5L11_09005 [Arhodomonas sp.]|nr:hypothetical protein [Arhodomonas sp.]
MRTLVADAEAASADGRQEVAGDALERALRLAPDHPVLWQNLAVVRYRQDRCEEAIDLARRSSDHTGDRRLRAQNWRLIATCREILGDAEGAAEAAARAAELEGER